MKYPKAPGLLCKNISLPSGFGLTPNLRKRLRQQIKDSFFHVLTSQDIQSSVWNQKTGAVKRNKEFDIVLFKE